MDVAFAYLSYETFSVTCEVMIWDLGEKELGVTFFGVPGLEGCGFGC